MPKLQNLYKHLMVNYAIINRAQWRHDYERTVGEVENVRVRIRQNGILDPNADEDKEFLRRLLYNKHNGISSRGQSVLSKNDFDNFIQNEDFMKALKNLIKEPTETTFSDFETAWNEMGQGNRPVLVNRVAAACTLDLSTTVDESKFDQVYSWLINEGLITKPVDDLIPNNWFSKNIYLMQEIQGKLQGFDANQYDEYWRNIFIWQLYAHINNPLKLRKQAVKYGAPGTGKTFQAKQETEMFFDIWKGEYAPSSDFSYENNNELVQFHPSFSYEDFIEGLRPQTNGPLALQNGVFKSFCQKAARWELDIHELGQSWDDLKVQDLDKATGESLKGKPHWDYIFDLADTDKNKRLSEVVPPYFFIIDEINRAELSRVFGELMYCLEYRGVGGRVKTQYANLNTKETALLWKPTPKDNAEGNEEGEAHFFIPSNLYLIGTMNTIDRSIESFDFALRRRFFWQEVPPNYNVLEYHLLEHKPEWKALAHNLENLNQAISGQILLGEDYRIGHAYLMNLQYPKHLTHKEVQKEIWQDNLRPLLLEYLRGTGQEQAIIINDLYESFTHKI